MFVGAVFLLCVAVCSAFRAEVRDPGSVKLSVYYESQCPHSRDFITKQLWPHWKDLEDGIKLDLVPYGKANHTVVEDHWEFTCQHGDDECLYNKLHVCVIKRLHSHPTKMLKTIKCLMGKKDQVEGLTECLTEIHLKPDTEKFLKCMTNPDTDNLLAAYGERTQKNFKNLDSVPKIVFNDKFKKRDQKESMKDFKKVVCRYIPNLCEEKNIKKEIMMQL